MKSYSLEHLADSTLLLQLSELVARDRSNTAALLAHLAEVDERKLFAPAGYPSMYLYCVRELHLSEDAAFKRIQVARVARKLPAIFQEVADGRLHLSGLVLLAPHLTPNNAQALMSAAAHKTKSEIAVLIAERFPAADHPDQVRAITPVFVSGSLAPGQVDEPSGRSDPRSVGDLTDSLAAPPVAVATTSLAPGQVDESPGKPDPRPVGDIADSLAARPVGPATASLAPGQVSMREDFPKISPVSPQRFALQTTINQATHDKLRRAQELFASAIPSGDLAQVIDRALDALILQLEKRKFAATPKPRASAEPAETRRIPANVRRTVSQRDGGRCTFVSNSGNRCDTRKFLEFDHIEPIARGGRSTVANVRLRCRVHNQFAAERTFGADFMRRKRVASRQARADTQEQAVAEAARAEAAEKARVATETVRAAAEAHAASKSRAIAALRL